MSEGIGQGPGQPSPAELLHAEGVVGVSRLCTYHAFTGPIFCTLARPPQSESRWWTGLVRAERDGLVHSGFFFAQRGLRRRVLSRRLSAAGPDSSGLI